MKSIFESWEIKDLIGKGNFGAVYEIEKDGEKEAMKVVNIYPSNSDFNEILGVDNHGELEEKTSLVMKEIDMLYHLKGNTHIVNYIDHYVDKKEDVYSLYLKMEYLQRLDNYYGKEIESDKALSITYDILDALTICEDNNIVHGDIKPQNIMVDNHGNNKLTDFGISKIMNQEKISNYTPAYAAPEIITDGRYTKQSDLYSLGLVIYQIYNNNLLPFMKNDFEKKDTPKIIERRLNKDVPAPTNGSKELNEFLSKALNRNPEERFQSAKEMKDELQRLDNNSLLPKVMVALPVMMAVAIKMNSFSVFGAELAKEGVKRTFVDTITSMSLTTKVIAGVVGCMIIGGGVYVGTSMNKVESFTTSLKENQVNVLNLNDKIGYEVKPAKSKVDISFENEELSYDNGIHSKAEVITVFPNISHDPSHNLILNDRLYAINAWNYSDHTLQGIDLKSRKQKFLTDFYGGREAEQLNLVSDEKGNISTNTSGFISAYNNDNGKALENPQADYMKKVYKLNDVIVNEDEENSRTYYGNILRVLENGSIIAANNDGDNHYIVLSVNRGPCSIITKKDVSKSYTKGSYLLKINEAGEVLYESKLFGGYQNAKIAIIENTVFISYNWDDPYTERDKSISTLKIYDKDLKEQGEYNFEADGLTEVYKLSNDTFGIGVLRNGGLELQTIYYTNVNIDVGGEVKKYKSLIFAGENEMKKVESKYDSQYIGSYATADEYYYTLSDYIDCFVHALKETGRYDSSKRILTQSDFQNDPDLQYRFLIDSIGILDFDVDRAYNTSMNQTSRASSPAGCKKILKKYLGVDMLNTIPFYRGDAGLMETPSDGGAPKGRSQTYRYEAETQGDETIIKYYNREYNTLWMTLKIKGSYETVDFTILSAELSDKF